MEKPKENDKKYDPASIEKKWQAVWEKDKTYSPDIDSAKKPFYNLMMFPYPSAEGLHVGNMYAFTGSDIYGRFKRMQGNDVFEPIGLDGFGIHSENYALKVGRHPKEQAKRAQENFYRQMKSIGNGFDWSRRLETYDPEYYKWTQWLFIQLFKAGLAYRKKAEVNWCPSDNTVLADEQVIDGKCERDGVKVEKKELEQWFFRITKYAQRLLDNIDGISEKTNFVLLHGFTGSIKNDFFPWLLGELKGKQVWARDLPNSSDPIIEKQVEFVLKNAKFDKDTVLFGHSLGSVVALKVLERLKKPIKKLVLGAGFAEPGFVDKERIFEKKFDWKFDFKKIKGNVDEVVLLRASNDSAVPKERSEFIKSKIGGGIIDFEASADHMTGEQEPQILKTLLENKGLDWSEKVKVAQKNWIGKSEGAKIKFRIKNNELGIKGEIEIFTTRPDTLYGATFMVVSPEHKLVTSLLAESRIKNQESSEIEKYVSEAKKKTDIDRTAEGKEKTGVFSGLYTINPVNNKKIPIWIADYVLSSYGTGAIMAVPAHDQRDFEFARKYDLEIISVVKEKVEDVDGVKMESASTGQGDIIGSDSWNGFHVPKDISKVIDDLESKKLGTRQVNYHLRDWLISRQRYWGPPIPMIYCSTCKKNGKGEFVAGNVVFVHGCPDNENDQVNLSKESKDDHWIKWARTELEKKGYKVNVPTMPTAWDPDYKAWKSEFEKIDIDENSILVGHSCGGAFLTRWLSETGRTIKKLILVAPAKLALESQNDIRRRFYNFDINPNLKNSVESIEIFVSNDVDEITKAVEIYKKALESKVKHVPNKEHFFNAYSHGEAFPELLESIIENSNLSMLGWYAEKEENLPVVLPDVKDWKPVGTGKAPLANHPEFYETKCPSCGGDAVRETDVSDTFLDSSWYFLRYPSTDISTVPFDTERTKKWLPVDQYIGGAEHAVLHLLYSRFVTMALKDMGHLDFEEPFSKFYAHGLIIKDGAKMSKSKGNVVVPDEYIAKYGADSLRTYLMFIGPYEEGGDFSDSGIEGMNRFLKRVWKLFNEVSVGEKDSEEIAHVFQRTIKEVSEDIAHLKYNTAIAKLMELYNSISGNIKISKKTNIDFSLSGESIGVYLKLLAPFAPHMAEELWTTILGNKTSIHLSEWPKYDSRHLVYKEAFVQIHIDGKRRGEVAILTEELDNQEKIRKAAEVLFPDYLKNKEATYFMPNEKLIIFTTK